MPQCTVLSFIVQKLSGLFSFTSMEFFSNSVDMLVIRYHSRFFVQLGHETTYAPTDYGHSDRAFFQKFETFGLRQTKWAEILGGILAISSQTIGNILAL